ncbi:ATP-binding cassette domain-containing protein [Aureibaculum marinum]|uniref:ATP-binding cassette domain-containing protein n=1 Tax=Aureibaculum marinum TaxID=2487930 RepID=A0A3N4NU69_9FLAO|nr:ATP-binding cassette domain-containing protein [Aureibaculum marinum]RPD99932.1 ATP-binding cassette domain-containing protein [Aureibaculum marinum]
MIEVKDLYKEFDGTPVLKGINATFENGKTSLVIGTSGSGKTVFLKCLLGLLHPERGDISYDGNIYNQMSPDEKRDLKKDIGMVFQGSALFDSSTVEENVMFPLKMFTNQPYEERIERVNFVLNRVNLENANKKYPAELSGGMQKRVAIARAIVMNPKYLFCDEPNSGLDPKTSTVIDTLIQEITKEYNITTIINSHDMNSVMEIGEKIILLKNGVKAWEGTSDEVFRTDNKDLTNFVYSSNLFKKVREAQLKEDSK